MPGRTCFSPRARSNREALQAAESLPDDQLAALPGALRGKDDEIGFARKALQDTAGAHEAFLKAKNAVEEELKRSPDVENTHVQLAKVLAQLGRKGDAALAEAQRATELLPESKDAFGGPEITAGVAEVYTILVDKASRHRSPGRIVKPAQFCNGAGD